MKRILITSSLFLSLITTYAQTTNLGNGTNYFNNILSKNSRKSAQQILVDGKVLDIKINSISETSIIASLKENGSFLRLNKSGNEITGQLVLAHTDKFAYTYTTDAKGNLAVSKVDINKVLCIDYGKNNSHDKNQNKRKSSVNVAPRGTLQSLPGSPNVILIDMDGHNLPAGSPWANGNAFNAVGTNFTDAEQQEVWENVVEDYEPFNINITTSEAVYQAASQTSRMRIIVSDGVPYSAGGIALLNSFGIEEVKCCWVFPDKVGGTALAVAEACSHESGHTLGLSHDGGPENPSYYEGHNQWAPIMGVSYFNTVTHWSRGEYIGANNDEDDLSLINQYLDYINDDHANSNNTATDLKLTIDGTGNSIVRGTENRGIIEKNTDIDVFHFFSNGGEINFVVKPTCPQRTNIDIQASLYDKSGTLIKQYNTPHTYNTIKDGVTISRTLPVGDYYIHVDGVGTGDPTTGWSDYNSMGAYEISGNIVGNSLKDNDAGLVDIINILNLNCSKSFSPIIKVTNNGLKTLSFITAEVFIDDVLQSNQVLTLNIGSGISKEVTLETINFTTFGNKTIKIVLSLPNGVQDELTSNNTFSKAFTVNDGTLYQFKISSSSKNDALTWSITSAGAVVTDNTKHTPVQGVDEEVTEFCLAQNKCYTFTVTNPFKENSSCSQYESFQGISKIYKKDDIVEYNGRLYKANSDIWGVLPDTHWYTDLGPCPVANVDGFFAFYNVNQNETISNVQYSEYSSPFKADFCNTITDIKDDFTLNIVKLFPNPFSNTINVVSVNALEQIVIYNTLGQVVYKNNQPQTNQQVSLDNLLKGIYFFTAISKNGEEFSKKIVKE